MDRPPKSWLLAAWPGMGNVAIVAAGYLMQKLDMDPAGELVLPEHFDVQSVDVRKGIVSRAELPRSIFFRAPKPVAPGLDLTVFLGEAQPATGSFAFANALLDRAVREWKIDRVVTFASMASQLHPAQQPRIYGAATGPEIVEEMRRLEVTPLEQGQIGGMNGLLLGAAADRDIPGLSLLGEIPYFAAGVPNPKAARAVLDAFSLLAGFEIDLDELSRHAETVDRALIALLERLQAQGQIDDETEFTIDPDLSDSLEPAPEPEKTPESKLDEPTRTRIESLFEEASRDRSRAVVLKRVLDHNGVFKAYENRFLDLFKRAE